MTDREEMLVVFRIMKLEWRNRTQRKQKAIDWAIQRLQRRDE